MLLIVTYIILCLSVQMATLYVQTARLECTTFAPHAAMSLEI
jgi:hypothetical protein